MNAKTKALIVFSLIAVFAIGFTAGYFGEQYIVHQKFAHRNRRTPSFPTVEMMARELDLSAGQQAQLKELFSRNDERLKGLRSEIHQKLGDIRRELKNEIGLFLTAEQKRKFEAMLERHIQQRREEKKTREDMSRRNGPPDADKGDRP